MKRSDHLSRRALALMMALCLALAALPMGAAAETTLKKTRNLSATSTSGGKLTLKWSKVKNADGYEVYCLEPGASDFELVDTVTQRKYVRTGHQTDGTEYQYKVRAYASENDGTVTYGEFTRTVTVSFVEKPTGLKLSRGTGRITVNFTPCEGADGYQVYIRTSGSSYYKAATISSDKSKCTISSLASGTTYYVKVRAYWKSGGRTCYSPYTAVKSITTK